MKVNKLSSWVYGILMLLPFLMFVFYVLMWTFNRGSIPSEINSFQSFCNTMELNTWDYAPFSDIFDSPFYSSINSFVGLFGQNSTTTFISAYLTWGITISIIYLGYEVLLAFINIARKLVYAFVDKEF